MNVLERQQRQALNRKFDSVLNDANVVCAHGYPDRHPHLHVRWYGGIDYRVTLQDDAPGNAYAWDRDEAFINVGLPDDEVHWDSLRKQVVDTWFNARQPHPELPADFYAWLDSTEDDDIDMWIESGALCPWMEDEEEVKDVLDREVEKAASINHILDQKSVWVTQALERFEDEAERAE